MAWGVYYCPSENILDISGVLQIFLRILLFIQFLTKVFLVKFIIFKNFDKVNAHQIYLVSAISYHVPIFSLGNAYFLYTRIVFVNMLVQNGSWFQAQNDPVRRALIMRNFQQHIRNDKNKTEKRESFET